jgi:hypothetical protein
VHMLPLVPYTRLRHVICEMDKQARMIGEMPAWGRDASELMRCRFVISVLESPILGAIYTSSPSVFPRLYLSSVCRRGKKKADNQTVKNSTLSYPQKSDHSIAPIE